MNKEQEKNDKRDIDYYYQKNRFFNILFSTKKYNDLWRSKEALVSLVLSLGITLLLWCVLITSKSENETFIEVSRSLLPVILGGFFSLLGLTIGGLAIITGTIEEEIISKIREKRKFQSLISIIYNFYFCGALIGFSMVLSILAYIITYMELDFNMFFFLIGSLLFNYFLFFSIIYSVMLLGTCIRIFLLRYFYVNSVNKKD
ncbi:hypothetical protein HUN88_04080 [Bacillus amyloliquefaciens]|uniref:hypothetical protein n=1 Tax=Bacillus amyloliquefaciens group TaxID=1938374 RepID=UPI0013D21901|nr:MULTISPECIES: hypothetical protein [Bacillus amyloliquefaciens group]MCA1215907.1 hypothetical protein [Bacillus amyloliquefaciens]NUI58946.1 hypothetical protein [Bacillus amyloliquefaciens]